MPALMAMGYESVPEEDVVRLQWWGLYHDKPKVGTFMLRLKIPSGILSPAKLRESARSRTAVISRGTCPDQEVVVTDVRGIAAAAEGLPGPALVVVGEVVGLRERLRGSGDESQLYISQPVG